MFKFIFVFLFFLTGCNTDSSTNHELTTAVQLPLQVTKMPAIVDAKPSQVITLQNKQPIEFESLRLRLVAIEDSRCATGLQCIWAGQMIVTLDVSNAGKGNKTVKLVNKGEPLVESVFGYKMSLLNVLPHPKKNKVVQFDEQTVEIQIETQ